MLRKLNRAFQDYMREKRLKLGKYIWDRKKNKEEEQSIPSQTSQNGSGQPMSNEEQLMRRQSAPHPIWYTKRSILHRQKGL